MYGITLGNVQGERDLGVTIDNDLKFRKHTAAVSNKANQILGLVKKSSNTRDKYTIST